MGITKKELFERAKKIKVYEVIKPLDGWFARYRNKGVGEKYNSEVLFDRGYNINKLLADGKIIEVPKVFPFEKEIVGKNYHSVYVRCKECLKFGINMPLETDCPNCGYSETITYYDAETIQKYINKSN